MAMLFGPAGRWAIAEEASSPSYTLDSSVVASSGGESSSPSYTLLGVAGQSVETGYIEGIEFNADNGFFNDSDLDGDGVGGSEDLCPTQFSGCLDLDHNGCVDSPDPDGDGDGVTIGGCDCNDAEILFWDRPGETGALSVTGASVADLSWTPPLDPGGSVVFYDVLRSLQAGDFVSPATDCYSAGADPSLSDAELPDPGIVFFYLVRGVNGCAEGVGSLGVSSNLVLRTGRVCP
jgi:hypothetical protein